MKKISLFVLALAFFAACKNDPPASSNAADNTTSTSTETSAEQAEKIAAGKANAVAGYKKLNDLITEIDACPKDLRNTDEVQAIRHAMGDISGKAERMMQVLDANDAKTATAPQTVSTSAVATPDVQDAITSMKAYEEEINAARAKFDQLSEGQKN